MNNFVALTHSRSLLVVTAMLPKVILLQLAAVALYTQCLVAYSSTPPHCPTLSGGFENLDTGDAVTLSLNCSSATLMPIITFETVESFSGNLGTFSVDYVCNSSDVQIEPTGTILKDGTALKNIAEPSGIVTVSASFSEGTECTFYGCYRSQGVSFGSSLAIQPTPCVIDINECEQGVHNCDVNAECSNTVGSFECRCNAGFTGNGIYCDDIDECAQGDHNCDVNATCNNTMGSFECDCDAGFTGNGTNCSDIDECDQDSHNCDITSQCENTMGSFDCICDDGGFTANGTHCNDIDECEQGDHNCDLNAECSNTVGSFECDCYAGFTGNGTICDDIDECERDHNCDVNSHCKNTVGSFECRCNDGFTGTHCNDINECEQGGHNCDVNATCNNTMGGFECDCDIGFTGNGTYCDDIDECEQDGHNCDKNATCNNTMGSFECICDVGFTGSGTYCDAASSGVGDYVQFIVVAIVIFVTSVATLVLLGIVMYIRKVKKRQHSMWSEMNKHFKKTMKEMKVDLNFEPVKPHTTLPYSPSFLSDFDVLVADSISAKDEAVIDHKIKEHILEPSANGDTGDSDCHDEDYESMDLPNERPSVRTHYIVQAHNQGSGDTQEKDTGYVYTDTLSPDSNDHSTFAQTEALDYDYDINSEHDFAVSSSGQYSDNYINEHSIAHNREILVSESSFDWSVVWQEQSSISFPEKLQTGHT